MPNQDVIDALSWRYATKVYDPTKKVPEEDIRSILEAGRLAPSSFGIEPWKFFLVEDPDTRKKLRAASYDQPKVTDASHLIVIARRTDGRERLANELIERTAASQQKSVEDLQGLRDMVQGSINAKSDEVLDAWIRSQTYIPLGIMIEAASLRKIDTGPMEGFDPKQVDEILGLGEKNLTATTMLALGYRGEDPYAEYPKTRRAYDEVVEVV